MSARSAYIHVPFCAHRCGYCNFTLLAGRDDLITAYLEALEKELAFLKTPRQVDTLYLGGGTPTHLSPEQLGDLLQTVLRWHPLAPRYEFSVEANPADLDQAKLEMLTRYGVTRISLGAQSFQEAKLRLLERDHSATHISRATHLAREYGLAVSLDLIFGVPGETVATWKDDLEQALALVPDHLSTYGLTFERCTSFWSRLSRGELTQLDEELERSLYLLAIDRLAEARFEHYEVSNFSRPGHRCRHNEVYWSGAEYFAAGPGAARYVEGRREMNHRSTTYWLRRVLTGNSPVAEQEELTLEGRAREGLVFGLRRLEGVERERFASQFGYAIDDLAGPALARYVSLGLLSDDGTRLRLTREGLLVSDSLWPDLLGG